MTERQAERYRIRIQSIHIYLLDEGHENTDAMVGHSENRVRSK